MNTIPYFIKRNFPQTYSTVRSFLFPVVSFARRRKGSQFTAPVKKLVSVLGYSYTINLDPSNGFIDTQIFTTGSYELDILTVMKHHLKSGDTFIDIGGNIGWHTLFGAQVVGPTGHVYTFEPIQKLVAQLNSSIDNNTLSDRVTIFPFGCSTQESTQQLNINPINIGGSSVFSLKTASNKSETITLKRADTVLAGLVSNVTLIKIDTEGYELEALTGLTGILENHKPTLLIEYSPSFWGDAAFDKSRTFFALLAKYNYQIFDLESGHVQINPTDEWIKKFTKLQTNFLCISK